jgi:hypothetical protein
MEGSSINGYSESRRANRVTWERPVWITQPVQISAHSVNASAVGLLIKADRSASLACGDVVSFQIPRADGAAILNGHGRVARTEVNAGQTLIALEIL